MIWCVAIAALGIVTFHGHAHAQTPGCMAMEVPREDQAAFTQRSSPIVDRADGENEPRRLAQQDAIATLVRVPLPRPREKQRDDKDYATNISTREKAFAGQNLADYCDLKIKSKTGKSEREKNDARGPWRARH
jgi:hypothetical protein